MEVAVISTRHVLGCAALLAVAVGVVLAAPRGPQFPGGIVRYEDDIARPRPIGSIPRAPARPVGRPDPDSDVLVQRHVAAHLGCTRYGAFTVDEGVAHARVRFDACRGDANGCAASGGNWAAVRVCGPEGCTLMGSFTPYGRMQTSAWLDAHELIAQPGRYTVDVCDAGCGQAPSETFGPCCDGDTCGTCPADASMSQCTQPYDGAYSWVHVARVEVDLD